MPGAGLYIDAETRRLLQRLDEAVARRGPRDPERAAVPTVAPSIRRPRVRPYSAGRRWEVLFDNRRFTYDSSSTAIEHAKALIADEGGQVLILDELGQILRAIDVDPVPPAKPPARPTESSSPRTRDPAPAVVGQRPSQAPPAAQPGPAPDAQAGGGYRLFINPDFRDAPYTEWNSWRVRPGPHVDALEIEIGHAHLVLTCYLLTDNEHHGINAIALFGDTLDPLVSHLPNLARSEAGRSALANHQGLVQLLTAEDPIEDGLGYYTLLASPSPSGYGWGPGTYLLFTDAEADDLGPNPHAGFLVRRINLLALTLITELLTLQIEMRDQRPGTSSMWTQADQVLGWLDTNLSRAVNILSSLQSLFGP
jgi:hypothetical protein